MEKAIRQFMENNFLFEFNEQVTPETDLFKAGIMDSFGYIQLVKFLQSEFKITFTEEEMISNVMVSLRNIVELIDKKLQLALSM